MKRGPMDFVEQATLESGTGLVGNTNQGGRRQVTILEREVWAELMAEVAGTFAAFRAPGESVDPRPQLAPFPEAHPAYRAVSHSHPG